MSCIKLQSLTQISLFELAILVQSMMTACCLLIFILALVHYSAVRGSEVCESGSVRLSGLNSSYVGYVQVCKKGQWTSITYEGEEDWTRKNSIVTCRELGFNGSVRITSQEHIMSKVSASSLQYHSVQCTGLEAKLADCVWTTRSANSKLKNVMTLCKDPHDSEVILVGMSGSDSEGIVALYNTSNYRWSTICNTGWDNSDADVVCKQLGFKGGASTSYSIEPADSEMLPKKQTGHFECSGAELELDKCKYFTTFPPALCGSEFAGVICTTESTGSNKLNLTTILLVVMIVITVLLIAILLAILQYTLKKLRFKPSTSQRAASQPQRTRPRASVSLHRPAQIIRTQLDPEMPYAMTAPPSYSETILADSRVQDTAMAPSVDDNEEAELIPSDTLSTLTINESP